MCNNLDTPQNFSFHHFFSFSSANHIQNDVQWGTSDVIATIMQIICNNLSKKKNISIERQPFYKWFCAINLHYLLGSSQEAVGTMTTFHSVRRGTKVRVQRHAPSISVSASREDSHINKWSKICLLFSPQGNEIQMVSVSSMGRKKKSLNKIDYNQLHSLMQDDKWSDFSERSLVKLNFKIFNSWKKVSRWKSKFYRALKKKRKLYQHVFSHLPLLKNLNCRLFSSQEKKNNYFFLWQVKWI